MVGVDLSLTGTGLSRFVAGRIDTDLIKTIGRKTDTLQDRSERLTGIAHDVRTFALAASLIVIEAPSYGSKHGAQHDRSGLWWLVVNDLIQSGHEVATVSPQGRAKYATGKGNADKDSVLASAIRRYPDAMITNNNVADAVILGAMGKRRLGEPVEEYELVSTALDAMSGVAWPGGLRAA